MEQTKFLLINNDKLLMQIGKIILNIILLFSLTILQVCGQQTKMRIYKGDKYTLEYPVQWQSTNENGILNFFPIENFGALTLSKHSGIDFPLEKTKQFILDVNEVKDKPENVKMLRKGNLYEFTYQHIDKDVKWVTKAFRNKTDFYLLTINCELSKWDTNKDMFIKVINSFKIN